LWATIFLFLALGVVVKDFDIMGTILSPCKADAKLIIDSDAVLASFW
jgi:hypothetical protein